MKRSLALASALGIAALGLSACDGSPPAVSVNGQVLTVAGFNSQLAQWTADKTFVASINTQSQQQAAQQGGGQAPTVAGQGLDGVKSTISSTFVNQVLTFNIQSIALQQYVDKHGGPATAEEVETSRAINESSRSAYWDTMPEALRDIFINFVANEGVLTAAPSAAATAQLQQQYQSIQPAIFSSVCLIEGASPDLASAGAVVASGTVTGAQVCFDQQQFESQPQAFQAAVLGLTTVGQIAQPLKTSFGYQVLELNSRNSPPLDAGVAQVLTAASTSPQQLSTIFAAATVTVNAAYGTWMQSCLVPPGVSAQQACGQQQ